MQNFFTHLSEQFPPHRIKQQEPLSQHTSFKSGGFAQYYCEVTSPTEMVSLVNLAKSHSIPITLLGGGSNVLFSDNGVEGLVIKNNCRKFEMMSFQGRIHNKQLGVDRAFVYAESGALTNQVVRSVIEQGYQGLEYALGLPGTVGGAIATNAEYAPNGFVISDALHNARILTSAGEIKEVEKSYFHFENGYTSIGKTGDVILSVMFVVTPGYKPTVWERAQEAATYRTDIPEAEKTFGMTYRNLSLDKTQTMLHHNSLPSLEQLLIHAQIPGRKNGDVSLSLGNPRFICNFGEGTTKDALALLHACKKTIMDKYSTTLSIQMGEIGV